MRTQAPDRAFRAFLLALLIAPALVTWDPGPLCADQFVHPFYVAVDGTGNIYVTEPERHRVQKFGATGAFVAQWGTYGSGNGQLNGPRGIAVDTTGNVYVADYGNSRIQKFTTAGVFVAKWTVPGVQASPVQRPIAVAVDGAGNVYVTGTAAPRVQVFSGAGARLNFWGGRLTGPPAGIAVDPAGFVYVSDTAKHRVQKNAANGAFVGWAGGCSGGTSCDIPNQRSNGFQCGDTTCSAPISGSGAGQFLLPAGLAFDAAGNLYVADSSNHRVQKFDANGYSSQWGSMGTAGGQFRQPLGVAAAGGSVYIADTGNNRVQKTTTNGVAEMVWGADVRLTASPGEAPGFINTITLSPASSQQSVITVQSLNQFAGPVDLSVYCCIDFDSSGPAPTGVSAQLVSSQVNVPANGSAMAVLNLSASSVPLSGKFIARVSATNAAMGINREVSVVFTVLPAAGADLTVSSSLKANLFPPTSATAAVSVASVNQFAGRVSLSASCCFDVLTQQEVGFGGVSASVSPLEVDLQPNGSAIANLTVATSGPPLFGKFLLHVKAKHAISGIDREARPAFTVLPLSEIAPACLPSVVALPLKPALEGLITAKEKMPPPAIVTIGVKALPDVWKLTLEEDSTLLPTEANIVLQNQTGHEKEITSAGCSSAPQNVRVLAGQNAQMKIKTEDRTLVFKKIVCTRSFFVCLSTAWVDVAVFPEPGFWRVFGGRKATFTWLQDH